MWLLILCNFLGKKPYVTRRKRSFLERIILNIAMKLMHLCSQIFKDSLSNTYYTQKTEFWLLQCPHDILLEWHRNS